MFDSEKFNKCMEKHPLTGKSVTQFEVSMGTQLTSTSIWKIVKGITANPNFDTVERLALYFFGDHRKISELQDDRPPTLIYPTAMPGSMTVTKKKVKTKR